MIGRHHYILRFVIHMLIEHGVGSDACCDNPNRILSWVMYCKDAFGAMLGKAPVYT